ncbi:MAG TPA: hypothetical protein EYN07_02610 [Flavobacteriaceae bacterium]|nr:hypothetical protein [Flavobacteriaceae bacterium]HIN98111.1 hypothetical protein [Flavobacteriaceae bacterium]
MKHLNFNTAKILVSLVIQSCTFETQCKLINYIYKHGPEYQSEWDKKHGIPSLAKTRELVIESIKSKNQVSNPKVCQIPTIHKS